jgi:hypothetical protein
VRPSQILKTLGGISAMLAVLAAALTPEVTAGVVWVVVTACALLACAALVIDWCAGRGGSSWASGRLYKLRRGHLLLAPAIGLGAGASLYWGHHATVLIALVLFPLGLWFDAYSRMRNSVRFEAADVPVYVGVARRLIAQTVTPHPEHARRFPRTLADHILHALSHFDGELSPLQVALSWLIVALAFAALVSGGLDDAVWVARSMVSRAGLAGERSGRDAWTEPGTTLGTGTTATQVGGAPPSTFNSGSPTSGSGTSAGGVVQGTGGRLYEDTCHAISRPGEDAPRWARGALYRLYLGPAGPGEDPPGASAGCAGPTVVPRIFDSTLAYVVGVDPESGETLSIAVDSRSLGSAIFLAPAVGIVRSLLARGVAVGGYPRVDVGNGDIYCLETPTGSELLVRAEKTARYVALPPGATAAFVEAVERLGWLWPRPDPTRTASFELSSSAISPERTVTLTFESHKDVWIYGGRLQGIAPSSIDLSLGEVEAFHGQAGDG